MITLEYMSLSSELTRYIVSTEAGVVHLFGTGRDGISRFYVRCNASNDALSPSTTVPCGACAFYHSAMTLSNDAPHDQFAACDICVIGRDGTTGFKEFSDNDYSSAVLSRELWIAGSLPDLKECGICVLHVSAETFLFDMQCALRLFTGIDRELVFENDKRDPRCLYLKCNESRTVYPFRVAASTFVPLSRGCVLAIHDVTMSDVHTGKANGMDRCRDSPYRFHTKISVDNIDSLCSYLQCAKLSDSAELVITMCSRHGTIRVIDRDHSSMRSRFEVTIACKSSEVTSISHKRQRR